MKKLTTQNKKYFKSIMNDLIYRLYHLDIYYKYSLKVDIDYDNSFKSNLIYIELTTQYNKDSVCKFSYYFNFRDNFLTSYSMQKLTHYGYYENTIINENEIDKLNTIMDNVKEFYNGVADNE